MVKDSGISKPWEKKHRGGGNRRRKTPNSANQEYTYTTNVPPMVEVAPGITARVSAGVTVTKTKNCVRVTT